MTEKSDAAEHRAEVAAEKRADAADAKAEAAAAEHRKTAGADNPPAPRKGSLAKASESGDPDIQRLLAEVQTAQMNRDALNADPELVKEAERRLAEIKKELNEKGYE